MNSYILYTLQNPDKRRRLSHEQFRVTLATDLLYAAALVTGSVHYGPRHQSLQPAARLTERHFPISLGKSPAGWLVQHECSVCSRRKERQRKTTTYKCRECILPMCIVPYFELYHTKRDLHAQPRASMRHLEPVCNTEGTHKCTYSMRHKKGYILHPLVKITVATVLSRSVADLEF